MNHEIINNINSENTANSKNKQGKKLCIITHEILTSNNSIKIEGVLYSMRGMREWVKTEVKHKFLDILALIAYDMSDNPYYFYDDKGIAIDYDNISKIDFVRIFDIRSPYTNMDYDTIVKDDLFEFFIKNNLGYNKNSIYEFIKK
jgi:hypothetical protein